ncbi:uncharacterized protein [Ambystoma mexicanum]|uniref:uncharacterized protein n=1 Tax=Ambystoma mexicanum TaxID=8296 RepID=UPI0037E92D9A
MGCSLRSVLVGLQLCFWLPCLSFLHSLNNGVDWYLGCYSVDILDQCELGYRASAGQEVNISSCSKFCLRKGFGATILGNEDCFCGNMSKISFNNYSIYDITSTTRIVETRVRADPSNTFIYRSNECPERCAGAVCLPYGNGTSRVAVYSSDGPYIYNASASLVADIVHTGKYFLLEISGYLASTLGKTLGIQDLTSENFTTCQLLINWTKENTFCYTANVQESGYFTVSVKSMYVVPGSHTILIRLANLISEEEILQTIQVFPPAPGLVDVKVEQTEAQMPSCLPFEADGTAPLERVFRGTNYTLVAFVPFGTMLDFQWWFSDDNSTLHTKSMQADGLTSSMTISAQQQQKPSYLPKEKCVIFQEDCVCPQGTRRGPVPQRTHQGGNC